MSKSPLYFLLFAVAFTSIVSGQGTQNPVSLSKTFGRDPRDPGNAAKIITLQQAIDLGVQGGDIGTNKCAAAPNLACALPNLYGRYGLVLPNTLHSAHFNSGLQDFSALTTAIATQLTLLPLASPASGFTYEYDPSSGVYSRSADSFGPVLTERAETIGRHKLYFGGTFQRFRFNKIDGISLHALPAVFSHQPQTGPNNEVEPWEQQFVSTQNSIDLKINQFTLFSTFGLTNRIDVSIAVPLLQVGYNINSVATIRRIVGTEPRIPSQANPNVCCSAGPPYAHYFDPTSAVTQAGSLQRQFSNDGKNTDSDDLYSNPSKSNAAGIGDVTFRLKGTVYNTDRTSLALLTDVRLPTGDESNFLGSGAFGIKPFVALSVRTPVLTPHLNAGYQWNGQSILAGSLVDGTKAKLPGFVFFSTGADIGISKRVTFAADYIGQQLLNAPRVVQSSFTAQGQLALPVPSSTFATIKTLQGNQQIKESYNQSNAAFGFKINAFDRFLFSGNLLVALNDGGLRQRVTPLVGLSYTF